MGISLGLFPADTARVDGIFTADPRKVSTARLLSAITPLEAAELTYVSFNGRTIGLLADVLSFWGSEVIHRTKPCPYPHCFYHSSKLLHLWIYFT